MNQSSITTTAKNNPARRRKKGRPTVFTTKAKRRLVRAIGAGVPMRMACASCRVSYSAFCEFRNANPKFEEKIQKAVADAVEWHLQNIIAAARSDPAQSRWFLEHTQSSHFGRTKIEVTGADGEPLAGTQIAVLVWPHQQNQNPQHEILDTEKNHPALTSPDAN
jgi:hypothetical protein